MRRIALTLAAVTLLVAPPTEAERRHSPHVLIVTVDTLRADRLSSYGYEAPTSPHLDRLLDGGVRFDDARTIEPLTAPALASLVTGVEPHVHGSSRNGLKMQPGLTSLPKILGRRGWHTAAFVANWTLRDEISGQGEHFADYEGVFTRKRWFGLLNSEATAEDVNEAALEWLSERVEDDPGERVLLWVHYVEPHAPYRTHDAFLDRVRPGGGSRDASARYDTEVAFVDHHIGELLGEIGRMLPPEETLVVFASDHGESLGEHGYWGHGRHLWEPTVRIPMGLTWPGRLPARVVPETALITDLPATVLGLLGLPVPDGWSGFDWTPVLTGDGAAPERAPCLQAHKGAVQFKHESDRARSKGLLAVGRVEGEQKEIFYLDGERLLYDLDEDPLELVNRVGEETQPSSDLLQCLGRIMEGLEATDRLGVVDLDEGSLEQLRSLGYLD